MDARRAPAGLVHKCDTLSGFGRRIASQRVNKSARSPSPIRAVIAAIPGGESDGRLRDQGLRHYTGQMTTLTARQRAALLIIDVQNGVVKRAYERDAVIANIGELVGKARKDRVSVVWVQHSSEQLPLGSDDWQIVPELVPDEAEPVIGKNYGDAFENTKLEAALSELGVGRLFVVGAQTDACIRSTLHGACVRGYDVTLVSDAHTTENRTAWGAPPPDQVIAHTNLYWKYQTAPGRTAGTVAAGDVDFSGLTDTVSILKTI
jgi:hypothetical protein